MAAQERAKAAEPQPQQQPPPPAFDDDLLMSMDDQVHEPPPPAFDAVAPSLFAPPPSPPPTPAAAAPLMQWDPHAPSAPSASAPAMEDLYHAPPPPTMDDHDWGNMQIMAPPTQNTTLSLSGVSSGNSIDDITRGMDPAAVQAILGIDGLSDTEKMELLEEQGKIMADIERSKKTAVQDAATSRADAFEQRSFSAAVQSVGNVKSSGGTRAARSPAASSSSPSGAAAADNATRTVNLGSGQEVALHGQEKTRQAIEQGTAMLVQCLSCSNWMQVTESATLMFCPVCQVVSPVEKTQAAGTQQEAAQFKSDQELAEQLQKEEYDVAGREERQRAAKAKAKAKRTVQEEQSQSWMEWLGMSSATGAAATSAAGTRPSSQPPAFAIPAERPRERGELGVSRPPGSSLSSARTGEETQTISFSNSYDEQDGLLGSGGGGTRRLPAARVAQQQPLFNCVADSITSAASQALTALNTHALTQDGEGNVHGVDASSLLAVTNVGREQTRYEQFDDGDNANQK
jgi:hypothetical protein